MTIFIGFLCFYKIYKSEVNSVFVYRNSVILADAKDKDILFKRMAHRI